MSNFGAPATNDGIGNMTIELGDRSDDHKESDFYCDPGTFKAKLVDLEQKESKAGNPMVVFTFTTMPGQGQYSSGKNLKVWAVTTQGKRFTLNRTLAAFGIDAKQKALNPKDIIGKQVLLVVEHEERDDGDVMASVKKVLPVK